jgi:glycosyltransferase involved in cell wall biosynthesis
MKILFQFDKYLNSTMNWAERWIRFADVEEKIISAPTLIKNQYYSSDFAYWQSPYQLYLPENEWNIPFWLKMPIIFAENTGLYSEFLIRQIEKEKPELVHVQFGNVAATYLPVFQKTGIPLIATFNGYDYEAVLRKRPSMIKKYRALFDYASYVTTGGTTGAQKLTRLGCNAKKVKVVRLAIDPGEVPFNPDPKATGTLKLCQVATFTRKKGHLTTLKALKEAQKEIPVISLTMLGEPSDAVLIEELEQYIVKHNLNGVKFDFRVLPYDDLKRYFHDFDAFIHPSETPESGDCEGTPVTMMDAQLAGLPVLSTFHADIPEVVKDKESGILVAERDWEELGRAIVRFAKMDEEQFSIFQKNARRHIEENFDVRNSAKVLKELYSNASKEKKK